MRVLFLGRYVPPYKAYGGDIHFYRIAEELSKMDIDVDFINFNIAEKRGRIRLIRVDYRKLRGTPTYPLLKKISGKLNWKDYDIIHGFSTSGYAIRFLTKVRPPYIHSQLSSRMLPLKITHPIGFLLKGKPFRFLAWYYEKKAMEEAEIVAVASTAMAKILSKEYSVRQDKIVVIPRGVDIEKFKPTPLPHENVILSAGRLEKEKGFHHLLKSLKLVDTEWKLIIAGDGPWKSKLIKLSRKLGLADKVRFLEYVPHDQMPQLYSSTKIFSLLSEFEPFGAVFLEAMASARPVVATNRGGPVDFVKDGFNGFLVNPEDYGAAAEKISYLLENYEKAKTMGENGRKLVEQKYTWEAEAKEYLKVYDKII